MSQTTHPRIFLWSAPRTISTAFFRAMENRENIKVVLQPYSFCYYYGKDKISNLLDNDELCTDQDKFSMHDAYNRLINMPDDSPVFAKEQADYIMCREDPIRYVPEGYESAFLFRDPRKSLISAYRVNQNAPKEEFRKFCETRHYSMKQVWDLYQLVHNQNPEKKLFAVDGDDFVKEPEKILRAFCSHFGMEYEDSMLDWDKNPKHTVIKDCIWKPFLEDVISSKTIDKKINESNSEKMRQLEIPDYIEKLIEEDIVYYEKLSEIKFKL